MLAREEIEIVWKIDFSKYEKNNRVICLGNV